MIIRPVKYCYTIFMSAFKRMLDEDGLMAAGHIAFTAFLALFPFLIFLASLVGFLSSPEDVPGIIDLMFNFMPPEVANAMAPAISEVVNLEKTGLLTIGFIGTLWAASSGVESLRIALNRAYRVSKKRALWHRRAQSILFVGLGASLIFFMSLMVLFGPVIWNFVAPIFHLGFLQELVFDISRYILAVAILIIALIILHRYLPHSKHRIIMLLPGVLFTTLMFLLGGTGFSIYLANFNNYNVTYGSLGSIVIALIFFYITAILFIFGAYLNASLEQNSGKQSNDNSSKS